MKIDFNKVLVGMNGKELQVAQGVKLKVKDVCVRALLDKHPREALSEEEFIHRKNLMIEVQNSEEPLEISDSDFLTIKKLLLEVPTFSVYVIGQVFEILRGV